MNSFNTGVGLSNTRSRLQHLYGARHRFEFHVPPGGGLEVAIAIPFVPAAAVRSVTRMEGAA